jgi:hypothetical protein
MSLDYHLSRFLFFVFAAAAPGEVSNAAVVAVPNGTLKILLPSATAPVGSIFDTVPLKSRFSNITYGSLGAPDAVKGADAYWVALIAGGGTYYTAGELTSLSLIFNSAAPAVIFYEWAAWNHSNLQLANLLGATYLDSIGRVTEAYPQGDSLLIRNINGPVTLGTPGGMIGAGTPVFGDVIALAGPEENIAIIGDYLISGSLTSQNPNNAHFATNLADFLSVPEPGTSFLVLATAVFLLSKRFPRGLQAEQ